MVIVSLKLLPSQSLHLLNSFQPGVLRVQVFPHNIVFWPLQAPMMWHFLKESMKDI